MRFAVLLIGFVGVLLTGVMGVIFISMEGVLTFQKEHLGNSASFIDMKLTGIEHNDTGLILLLTAAYGAAGTLLGFLRCGKQGGVLLLLPVLFAAVMNPFSLLFTFVQAFAGVLSFFVSPLPINAPAKEEIDEEEVTDED